METHEEAVYSDHNWRSVHMENKEQVKMSSWELVHLRASVW